VNLTSYAELAVRLVNTAFRANSVPDPLGTTDAFGMLVTDHPQLSGPVTSFDLDSLRVLRTELSAIFTAAATGRDRDAVDRLNSLLVRSPIQPELVSHDDERWHVHLAQAGSVADRYAAGAVIGLALAVTCSIAACERVFIDASPGRSRRYCTEHSASRANVTTIRAQGRSADARHTDTAAS
jgi:hypothetical protein